EGVLRQRGDALVVTDVDQPSGAVAREERAIKGWPNDGVDVRDRRERLLGRRYRGRARVLVQRTGRGVYNHLRRCPGRGREARSGESGRASRVDPLDTKFAAIPAARGFAEHADADERDDPEKQHELAVPHAAATEPVENAVHRSSIGQTAYFS